MHGKRALRVMLGLFFNKAPVDAIHHEPELFAVICTNFSYHVAKACG